MVDADQKRAILDAKRGTLEHELYAAETDLEVAEATEKPELIEEPQNRVRGLKAQMKVLDDKENAL